MRILKASLLGLSLTLMPVLATAEPAPAAAETPKTSDITAKVNGMVCDFCARAVTKVFGKNDAVETVDVDLDAGAIHVDLKPGQSLDDETVARLIKKSGYDLVSIARAGA